MIGSVATATATATAVGSTLDEWLRTLPDPVIALMPAISITPQVRSLNISSEYADYLAPSTREHIQNWRDQCLSLAQRLSRSTCTFSDISLRRHSMSNGEAYALVFQGRRLGWMAWEHSPHSDGRRSMRIVNHSTALSLDILTLGHSSKRGVEGMAGLFGEGVKVEINRLVASRGRVRYLTANTEWTFFFEQQSEAQLVLSVRVSPCSTASRSSTGTDTEITLESLPEHAFRAEDFLFLSPPTCAITASGLSILLDPRLVSRVHLHGIFVKSFPEELTHFGLDFSGQLVSTLNLGRDRNNLNIRVLIQLVPDVFEWIVGHDYPMSQIELLSSATYNMLEPLNGSSSISGSMQIARAHSGTKPPSERSMANCLLQVFFMRHGENAIPSNEREHSPKHKEAALFGARLVFVEHELLQWLLLADNCPTLEFYWARSTRQVLALAEYLCVGEELPRLSEYPQCATNLWPSEQGRVCAMQLRSYVDQLFGWAGIRGEHVRFKLFGPELGNTKPIKPLKCSGTTLFIVDPSLMTPEALHRELQHEDATFECPSTRGKPCGCMRDALFETIISTSARPEVLRKRVMNRMAEMMPADATLFDAATAVAASASSTPSTATSHSQPTSSRAATRSASEPRSVMTERGTAASDPAPQPTSEPHAIRRGAARTMLQSIEQQAAAVGIFQPSGGTVETNIHCQGERHSSIKVGTDPHFGFSVFFDRASAAGALNPVSVTRFAIVLRLLAHVVGASLSTINIFWEDSQTVGYNKAGALFFNLCYFEAMEAEVSLVAALDFWFPVMVHELTHNSFTEHDARFALLVASLTTKYLGAMCEIRASSHGADFDLALAMAQSLE
mgnify:CR=1 FL=1